MMTANGSSWDPVWEEVFRAQEWGKYPPEYVIRFVARSFYGAPDRKAVRLLDLGCGPGACTWYMAREGFSAAGIDGSETAICRCAERLRNERLAADLKVGDYVVLHVGYALSKIDPEEAARTLELFASAGEAA